MNRAERNFNPRSPHGERHPCAVHKRHARGRFQPTLPARGATRGAAQAHTGLHISTHAPRTGSDPPWVRGRISSPGHFNPRSPHGERRKVGWVSGEFSKKFQPTLPARGATLRRPSAGRGRDYFNPRSPHGERQRKATILSTRIRGFAQKVYHKTVLLRIILAENAVILPKRPQNPVRTSLQKAGGLRFARAIRTARPYSISSPSGA